MSEDQEQEKTQILKKGEVPLEHLTKHLEDFIDISRKGENSWYQPKRWRQYARMKRWHEEVAVAKVREWYLARMGSYVRAIDQDMEENGFDPKKAEHFAVFQALIAVIPPDAKTAAKMMEMTAKYFGHFQDEKGSNVIDADKLADAFHRLAEAKNRGTGRYSTYVIKAEEAEAKSPRAHLT